jgi:hydrogenase expression/formation protein HypC
MSERPVAACESTAPEHCITCGDVAIPMRVIEVADDYAECVDGDGARQAVLVDLIGPVGPGDSVLVHAGVAIAPLEGAAP